MSSEANRSTDSRSSSVDIRGGAGPHESAAIAAAVSQALEDLEKQRSAPRRRPGLPAWVTVIRATHPGRPE